MVVIEMNVNPRDRIPEEKRCKAIKKDGTRCKNAVMPGSDYCYSHSAQIQRIHLQRSLKGAFSFKCNDCSIKDICPYYEKDAICGVTLPIKNARLKDEETLLSVWEKVLKLAIQNYSRMLWKEELTGKPSKEAEEHLVRITKAFDAFSRALERHKKKRKAKSFEDILKARR